MGRCSGALPRDGSNRSPPAPLSPASPSSPPTPLCTLNTPGQAWPTGQHLAGTLPFARLAGTYYVCDPVPCTKAPGWAAGTVLATPKCPHFAQARKVKVSPRFWPSLLAQAESCGSRLGRAAVTVAMEMTMSESGCWHPTGPGPQTPTAFVCPAAFFSRGFSQLPLIASAALGPGLANAQPPASGTNIWHNSGAKTSVGKRCLPSRLRGRTAGRRFLPAGRGEK